MSFLFLKYRIDLNRMTVGSIYILVINYAHILPLLGRHYSAEHRIRVLVRMWHELAVVDIIKITKLMHGVSVGCLASVYNTDRIILANVFCFKFDTFFLNTLFEIIKNCTYSIFLP